MARRFTKPELKEDIDPQKQIAIDEGRITYTPPVITAETIKTSFTPTEQQIRVLKAMEEQKRAEQEQARANSAWQKQQDSLQRKIQEMEAQRQQQEDFKNRTKEEVLQNFIVVQTQKELAGQFDNPQVPTNLNQYLAERGFDVTRPETIPTSVFSDRKLDTPEKLRERGVSENIIRKITNPNNTQTNVMTNTSIPFDSGTNWSGITESNTSALKLATLERQVNPEILYTPPNATNINQPVGRSTPLQPSVTTTGLSPPRTTVVSEAIETVVDPIPSNLSSLALLAGALIIS